MDPRAIPESDTSAAVEEERQACARIVKIMRETEAVFPTLDAALLCLERLILARGEN